jgi:hypothetical protein
MFANSQQLRMVIDEKQKPFKIKRQAEKLASEIVFASP